MMIDQKNNYKFAYKFMRLTKENFTHKSNSKLVKTASALSFIYSFNTTQVTIYMNKN